MTANEKMRCTLDSVEARSPSEEFKFDVPRNPYVSPYYATDESLKQLPPVKIIVGIGMKIIRSRCFIAIFYLHRRLKWTRA